MMQDTRVSIVVPVYERREAIHSFISQFLAQTFERFTLVVVDHGRTHVDYSMFHDPRLIILHENPDLWWTGAVNRGVEHALRQVPPCDFVLVINDDVRIQKTYLQSLVELGSSHPQSIIGSICISSATGRVMYAGLLLDKLRARFVPIYEGCQLHDIPDLWVSSDVLSGRGMLVPLRVFREIGLFDEVRLPHYGADNEFAWRARQRGGNLLVGTRCIVMTDPQKPPVVRPGTTAGDFIADKRRPGNLPAVVAFASLCFTRPYAWYYTGVNFLRCLLSYGKRSLRRACRDEDA